MSLGLTGRLVLSHTAAVLLATLTFATVLIVSTGRQADRAGEQVDRAAAFRLAPLLEQHYSTHGGWEGVEMVIRQPMMMGQPRMMGMPPGRPGERALQQPLADRLLDRPIIITSGEGKVLYRRGAAPPLTRQLRSADGVPLRLERDGQAYLFLGSMLGGGENPLAAILRREALQAAALTALILSVVAVLLSLLWARWFLVPITRLYNGSSEIAAGNYRIRIPLPPGRHELTELTAAFNGMAAEVEAQELSRRRFVGDAAHELRTPISLLTTRLQMLQEGIYRADNTQWEALLQDTQRLHRLVDDLQWLARADAGKVPVHPEQISLDIVMEAVKTAHQPAADERGVALTLHPGPPGCTIIADPERFRQVMANVINNALRYATGGKEIHIAWEAASEAEPQAVEIFVEDEGPGVAPSERERLFERFVRLDEHRSRESGGSGLGLAITRELLQLQGGTIVMAEPRYRNGARFVMTLPGVSVPGAYSSSSSKPEPPRRR